MVTERKKQRSSDRTRVMTCRGDPDTEEEQPIERKSPALSDSRLQLFPTTARRPGDDVWISA
jgi:hypothetical protein